MTTLETSTGPDRTTSETATPASTTPAATAPVVAPVVAAAARAPLGCSRRALLRRSAAAGAVGGGALVLAACGGDDTAGSTTSSSAATSAGGTDAGADGAGSAGVAAADVPVGEAVVLDVAGEPYVFAQPTAGEFVAFSAVCTHAGGVVAASGGTEVTCPLHDSVFDAADGAAVLSGPATTPLESETVTLDGDQLVLG